VSGFELPPYPYDRLDGLKAKAETLPGGCVDLSIGTPCDPPPDAVIEALSHSGAERGYPPSIGTPGFRESAAHWLQRRVGVDISPDLLAACIGTKEFVASAPGYLRLLRPDKDTVLYPEISYPSYEMGASLAGCRAVPVPVDKAWRIDLDRVDPADADRALCLWVNTPGNPAGGLDDLAQAASWGRARGIPVLSDECYVEYTWEGPKHSILEHGTDGLLAIQSLSKRSNMAGVRAGFYAGDGELVHFLREVRKHAGMMMPGPVAAAAIAAFDDDAHVEIQRDRYWARLELGQRLLARFDLEVDLPAGGFYLWVRVPDGNAWALTERLATELGMLVAPGEFYGTAGAGHVRVAMVAPDDRMALVAERAGL